ncbi:hypothetical protein [Desulfolutivibrio sulfoxidireducens]|uniref:hypothetical protein n=1 Tax=Desulfolutivibrio sulfoxidireducens TaxID=2773299 RepID=UPI00159E16D9|nr:hypothetical protein [Desulfolutivibrio sulfoxidireducens]QLA21316.1 hypothetical protein GD604_17080 [Desulfolutivibrio sulfoxidireducens]
MRRLPRTRRYLRAAPLPHLSTAVSLCAVMVLADAAHAAFASGLCTVGWLLVGMSSGWLGAAGLCQADALCRYREYRRVRAILMRRGFCPRALRAMSGSRCRRDAALLAAEEAGCGRKARQFFLDLGYRLRHIVPDRVVARPLSLFTPKFLRGTFVPGKKTIVAHEHRRPHGLSVSGTAVSE